MNANPGILTIAVLLVPLAAPAQNFTARIVPAGFNAASQTPAAYNYLNRTEKPRAAAFAGNGRLQWYAGGTVISRFPESGTIPLPAITLPAWTPATVKPLAGIPMDVDGDGDPDILRVNAWGGMSGYYTMMAFINQGGTFTPGWRLDYQHNPAYNEGTVYYRFTPGDFDRDGDLDAAVLLTYEYSNYDADPARAEGSLVIRWNDGTGQFSTSSTLQSTGFDSSAMAGTADLDNDGDLDLICNGQFHQGEDELWYSSARFFENNGSGGFSASTVSWFWPALPLDINRDGWEDLVSGKNIAWNNKSGAVSGAWSGPYNWSGNLSVNPVHFADCDGDGHTDMVYVLGKQLEMRRGFSNGSWSEPVVLATLATYALELGGADSDADGDMDLFVMLDNGSSVFVENRAHHWAPDAEPVNGGVFSVPGVTSLEKADFNRDGFDDLLAVAPSQKKLHLFYGEADGTPAAPVFKNTQNISPGGSTVADFDRDGRPDVAYTLPSAGEVRLATNNGTSIFAWTDASVATGLPGVTLITAGEHGTANGHFDLLTASTTTGQLRWHYRSGSSWLGQSVLTSVSPAPACILAANFTSRPGHEPFYLSADASTLRIRGYQLNPTWVGAGDLTQSISASPYHSAMARGDVNGDGKDEIVAVSGTGSVGYWLPATGSSFMYAIGTVPSAVRAIETVDWDRDGRTDVLCATATGLSLFTWKGWWKREDIYSRSGGFTALEVMDLNRDGFPDAAAANSGTGEVIFIRNQPRVLKATAAYSSETTLTAGLSGTAMQVSALHPGRSAEAGFPWLSDVDAAVTGIRVNFHRAVQNSGQWVPGTPLTKTELTQIMASASLLAGETVIGSSGPAALESDGSLDIKYNAVLGNLVPIAGGAAQQLSIRLTTTPGAAQSAFSTFYFTMHALQARVLDGGGFDNAVPVTTGATPVTRITIVPNYTPLQQWRVTHFGSPDGAGSRANNADYDGDGVPNLVEYATGTNPTLRETTLNTNNGLYILPITGPQAPLKCRLAMTAVALSDPKLKLTVQMSSGLTGWATLTSRTGGGAWTGLQPDFAIPLNGVTTHIFTTSYTPQNTKKFFLRLKVEELP